MVIVAVIFGAVFIFQQTEDKNGQGGSSESPIISEEKKQRGEILNTLADVPDEKEDNNLPGKASINNQEVYEFLSPLNRASERATKKKFGDYITPQNSPVQPEKFTGYHAGVDFEIFPEEINADVPVSAVCSGDVKIKQRVDGYGGVLVQSCLLKSGSATLLYGHLKLSDITVKVGEKIQAGDIIGVLGADKSIETDGERKHLHLGVHRGEDINFKGYVISKDELAGWIDPFLLF